MKYTLLAAIIAVLLMWVAASDPESPIPSDLETPPSSLDAPKVGTSRPLPPGTIQSRPQPEARLGDVRPERTDNLED